MYIVNIAIITCENYTCSQSIGIIKEQERKLNVKNYENVNYNPAYSDRNVILEHDTNIDRFKTFREYVKDYKIREEVSGRFNIDTTDDRNATKTLSCFVISGSKDFITSMTRAEQTEYFRNALNFLKIEYPSFHVVDARIHNDEKGLPHAHVSFIPVHINFDGKKTFNVSAHQKGKDYFQGFQNRFYDYIKVRYPEKNLMRSNPQKDHKSKLSVREYKEQKEIKNELIRENEKFKEKLVQFKEMESKINDRDEKLKELTNYHILVDEYCEHTGITLFQYEKQRYMAGKGYADYPEPELHNPDREIFLNKSEPSKDHEHEL